MAKGAAHSTSYRAAQIADSLDGRKELKTVALSNGIVLLVKKIGSSILIDIQVESQKGKPPVPEVWIGEKERKEENPNDPDYMEKFRNWQIDVSQIMNNAMLMRGTELSHCPKGIPRPESDEWLDGVTELGYEEPGNKKNLRYLLWLKFIALVEDENWKLVVDAVGKVNGVSEKEVQAVAESGFRSDTGQPTDTKPATS